MDQNQTSNYLNTKRDQSLHSEQFLIKYLYILDYYVYNIGTTYLFCFFWKKQYHQFCHFSFLLSILLHYELVPKLHHKPCQQFQIVVFPAKKQKIRNILSIGTFHIHQRPKPIARWWLKKDTYRRYHNQISNAIRKCKLGHWHGNIHNWTWQWSFEITVHQPNKFTL